MVEIKLFFQTLLSLRCFCVIIEWKKLKVVILRLMRNNELMYK